MAIVVDSLATLLTGSTDWGAGGLATGAYSNAGTAYTNRTSLNMWADFELVVTYSVAPTANTTVDLFLIPSVDNTNYGDGGGAVAPPVNCYAGSFSLRAVTTAQRIPIRGAVLPPDNFKAVALNNAGQTLPNTATVTMSPYKV